MSVNHANYVSVFEVVKAEGVGLLSSDINLSQTIVYKIGRAHV